MINKAQTNNVLTAIPTASIPAVTIQQNQNTTSNNHLSDGFMGINSIEEAKRCAEIIAASSFCPLAFKSKPNDVVVALQYGQELGLKTMQSLQNIAVINGRPCVWGDAMVAICRQSPDFEYMKEEYLNDVNGYICRIKRKNEPEFTYTFTQEDAIKAGLWDKTGPWRQYPKRMLQMRARGFCLRDAYADLLRGVISAEEARDYTVNNSKVGNVYNSKAILVKLDEGYRSVDEDVISESIMSEPITYEQVQVLRDKLKAAANGVTAEQKEENLCVHFKIQSLEEMQQHQFEVALKELNIQIKKKEKADSLDINKLLAAKMEEANSEV